MHPKALQNNASSVFISIKVSEHIENFLTIYKKTKKNT